jgi:hypothetical protein
MTKTWEQIAAEMDSLNQQGDFNQLPRNIINPVTIVESHEVGPKSLKEWETYESELLQRITKVLEGSETPKWENLFFKKESDFISGRWTENFEVWRTLIAQMPRNTRALLYHTVRNGADLFYNLKEIPRSEPVRFKNRLTFKSPRLLFKNHITSWAKIAFFN